MAPPSESKILSTYLLIPSPLPTIISLQEFIALFPKSLQSSPHIRTLYRDLQSQRNDLVDAVAADIEDEARRGKALRQALVQSRRNEVEGQEQDNEMEIERALFGPASTTTLDRRHTLVSILPELESAVQELQSQVSRMEEDEAALLASIRQTVGSMSDLRYGRLANPELRDQVLEGLADLQETCRKQA